MTDCMNMEFYRELYVSRSLKKREKRIIEGLKKKRFRKDLYLIVLARENKIHWNFSLYCC